MSKRARIAVIGTGWWATGTHIPAILENPKAELVALCDRDPERLDLTAEHFPVAEAYTDVNELLASTTIDGVIIATNHAAHYEIACRCLEHGLHVLVEKPLTLRASEARALVEIARRQERQLLVGYPYPYQPAAKFARDRLLSGDLGEIRYVNCIFTSEVLTFLRGQGDTPWIGLHGPGAAYADPALSGGGHGHTQLTHLAGLLFFLTGLAPI